MRKALSVMMITVFTMGVGATDVPAAVKGDAKPVAKKSSSYVSGTLSITKNDKGGVDAIAITTKSFTVYSVDMDGLTQNCSAYDGKEVKAYGEVKEVDGKMVLKVNGKIMKIGGDKPDKKDKGPAASRNQNK